MIRRQSSAIVLLVATGAVAAACTSQLGPLEAVGAGAAAMTGGAPDAPTASSPETNMTVAIESSDGSAPACSGVLLTSTVVLTARPCVNPALVGKWPIVRVGPSFATANRYFSTRLPIIEQDPSLTTHAGPTDPVTVDTNEQLALIFLDPTQPVLADAVLSPPQLHQGLQYPPSGAANADGSYIYSGVGTAGWSNATLTPAPGTLGATDAGLPIVNDVRQSVVYPNVSLYDNTDFGSDNPFWFRARNDGNSGALDGADLGGPLFLVSPAEINGVAINDRQVFGIAVATSVAPGNIDSGACPGTATACDVWVDLTSDPNLTWILTNLEVPVVASGPHKNTTWFQQHPKEQARGDGTPDWWLGEVDYTGACTATTDTDCDHWIDAPTEIATSPDAGVMTRDNCVGWFNPDQGDVDDDSFGDVCDNCPALVNASQGNSALKPPAGFGGVPGRVPDGTEEMVAAYAGDGCRLWTTEPVGNPSSISVGTPNNVWAVGGGSPVHWDGTSWTASPTTPNGETYNSVYVDNLYGDAFAVGGNGLIGMYTGGPVATTSWQNSSTVLNSSNVPVNTAGVEYLQVFGTSAYDATQDLNVWAVGIPQFVISYDEAANVWHQIPTTSLNLAPDSALSFVWGTSATDMWVGGSNVGSTLAHWNGSAWTAVNMAAWPTTMLTAMWGSSTSDLWVVGYDSTTNASQILHGSGAPGSTVWTETTGTSTAHFVSISGRGVDDVFAAASDGSIWHWNGATWSPSSDSTAPLMQLVARQEGLWGVSPLSLTGGFGVWRRHDLQWQTIIPAPSLSWVSDPAPNDVLGFMGGGNVVGWNGTTAATVADGNPEVKSSWGSSASDVWTVGWETIYKPGGGGTTTATMTHFNGSAWASVGLPAGMAVPNAVAGTSQSDVWGVGDAGQIIHFNGASWTSVPSGTANALLAVWAYSPTEAWAVGNFGAAVHWDGTAWSAVPGFTPRSEASVVWGTGPNDVWAAGNFELEHWDGTGWKRVEIGMSGTVTAMSGTGPTDVWATLGSNRVIHYDGTIWSSVGVEESVLTASSGVVGGLFVGGAYDSVSGLWVGSGFGRLTNLQPTLFAPPQCVASTTCGETTITCNPIAQAIAFLRDGVNFQELTAAQSLAGSVVTDAELGAHNYEVCNAEALTLTGECTPVMGVDVVACPIPKPIPKPIPRPIPCKPGTCI
jgi:hypothetical protein